MRLKKCIKLLSASLLAATIIVSVLPNQSVVKAEEYPDEILFPISILDFRADNLIFEYPSSGAGNAFANLGTGNLKGLVEDNLESNPTSIYYGYPVYKQNTVARTAALTKQQLEQNQGSTINVFRNWRYNGQINNLSMRHFIRTNEFVVLDAEDTGKYVEDYNNGHYGGIKHCTELGGSAKVVAGNNCLAEHYVSDIGGSGNGTVTFKYYNEYGAGNYAIKIFAMTDQNYAQFNVKVGTYNSNINIPRNGSMTTPPENPNTTIYNIPLVAGENTIVFSGVSDRATPNLDKIEIQGRKSTPYTYPLGSYEESKAKYNIDRINNTTGAAEPDGISDYGWFDVETCYDYAYFVLAHMFKYHPSLNKPYGDYNNLVFHKVESGGTFPYYEFMGDANHKVEEGGLIYNPGNKSIRNGKNADVNAAEHEFRTGSGQMFIVDRMTKDYPIDAKYNNHNFHYTVKTHSRFVYKKGSGQTFYFNGDDDVYVFVNGQLVLDLGGAHSQQNASVNLDTLSASKPSLDLKNGKAVDFDFFYCERHTTESNFYAKMNFKLANDVVSLEWPDDIKSLEETAIPYGYVVDLHYKFESNRELTTNTSLSFSDDFGDKIGINGFYLSNGVRLRDDKKLTITVLRDGKPTPEVYPFEFGDTKTFTTTESDMIADFFKTLQLEQGDSVSIDGIIYDTALVKFDNYTLTSEPRVRQMTFNTYAEYEMHMTMGGINKVEDTVGVPNKVTEGQIINVLVDKLTISVKTDYPVGYDYRDDITYFGEFKLIRPETVNDPSTPEDESIFYTNKFDFKNGKTTLEFDPDVPASIPADTEYIPTGIPRGRYKLSMDTDVLSGYKYSIEIIVEKADGSIIDVEVDEKDDPSTPEKENEKTVQTGVDEHGDPVYETFTFNTLYLDVEPKIIDKKWHFPKVKYILKAVRIVNPLKDLT